MAAVVAVLLTAIPSGSSSPPRAEASATVLSVYHTPGRIPQTSPFSVHLEVASTTNIASIWFTFCQLTSSLCYLPVTMNLQKGTDWYVGTTGPMTDYSGMNPGIRGGYNITIEYSDNSTSTEPAIPNAFANQTIAQSVTGEYMYEILVTGEVYSLTGKVVDAKTGAPVVGANVSVNAANVSTALTNATGGYTLTGIPNGTYNLTVTKGGYTVSTVPIAIAGAASSKDVSLTAAPTTQPAKNSTGGSFFTTLPGLGLLLVIVLVVVLGGILALRSRRKSPPEPAAPTGAPETP